MKKYKVSLKQNEIDKFESEILKLTKGAFKNINQFCEYANFDDDENIFVALTYAQYVELLLNGICEVLKLKKSQISKRVGYSDSYIQASIYNTKNKVTKRNFKIIIEIENKLIQKFMKNRVIAGQIKNYIQAKFNSDINLNYIAASSISRQKPQNTIVEVINPNDEQNKTSEKLVTFKETGSYLVTGVAKGFEIKKTIDSFNKYEAAIKFYELFSNEYNFGIDVLKVESIKNEVKDDK